MRRVCVRALVLLCAIGVLIPATALADATAYTTYDRRKVEHDLSLQWSSSDNYGFYDVEPPNWTPFDYTGGYTDMANPTSTPNAKGSVWTTQTSEFVGGTTFSEFVGDATAMLHMDVDTGNAGANASGNSKSLLRFYFTVSEPQPYTFSTYLYESGGDGANAYVTLKDEYSVREFSFNYDLENAGAPQYFEASGTLVPGKAYELVSAASAVATIEGNGTRILDASVTDMVLTVPEPGTLAMVALAGVAVLRRRR